MWTVGLLVRSLPFQGSQVGFESHTVYQDFTLSRLAVYTTCFGNRISQVRILPERPNNKVPRCSWMHACLSRMKKGIVTPWDRQNNLRNKCEKCIDLSPVLGILSERRNGSLCVGLQSRGTECYTITPSTGPNLFMDVI